MWLLVGIALVVVVGLVVTFLLAGRGDSDSSGTASPTSSSAAQLPGISTPEPDSEPSGQASGPVGDVSYFVEQDPRQGTAQDADKWRIFAIGMNGKQVTAEERYGPSGNDGGGCFVGERVGDEFVGVLIADVGQKLTIPFTEQAGELRLTGEWSGLSPATLPQVSKLTTAADQGPIDLARCEEYWGLIASGEVQVIE